MTNKQVTKWYVTINKDGKTIHRRAMTNYSRIMLFVQANYTTDCTIYVKADYGKHKDNFGDIVTFDNEGEYPTYKEALSAARAFQEVAIEWAKEAQ